MSMRGALVIGVAVGVLTLTGCRGNDTTASPGTPDTPTSTATTAVPSGPSTSTATAAPPVLTTASPRPGCAETSGWDAGPKTADGSSRDALYLVRAGRHDCYDRVVFDINGSAAAGFSIRYVPVVTSDPKGDPLPVAGDAVLQVVVRAPELGADDSGHQPGRVLARTGDYFYTAAQLANWGSLRAVRFAGFFEGQCTFAVGVRAKLPFRVFTQLGPQDQVRRVVVDVAH